MQTSNVFSIDILMFCNNIYKSKNLILSLFVKFENTRN